MKREIIFSAIFHVVLISSALFSAPFSMKKDAFDYDQVIKVKAISASQADQIVTKSIDPPTIPEPVMTDDDFDIPIDDPTSVDKPVQIDKPKPKPKPKPKKKKQPPKQPTETNDPSTSDTKGKEIDTKNTDVGSPFAGATVDNEAFTYPYWFTQAFNKFSYNWKNTVAYDGTLICVVKFEVIKSGKIYGLEVESSSGMPSFDQTCLAAIQRSNPLPPLPNEFRDEIIAITIPFKYQPR